MVAQHGQKSKRTNAPSASDRELNQLVNDIQAAGISAKRALKSKCANLGALDDKIGSLEKPINPQTSHSAESSANMYPAKVSARPDICEKAIDVHNCLHDARNEVEITPSL